MTKIPSAMLAPIREVVARARGAGGLRDGGEAMPNWRRSIVAAVRADWHAGRFIAFGAAVAAVSSLITIMYYVNRPDVPDDPDSPIYILVAHQVAQGHFVDRVRTPGYPLFIVLVSRFAGWGNLQVISIAQGVLFVLASIGTYGLAALLIRRAWAALLAALPVAANVMLLSYVQPIMTEAQGLLLLVCLALGLTWFVRSPRPRGVWVAMGILFALAITRPEWVYFAAPFVGFLLLVSWRAGALRRVLPHAVAALLLFSGLCGLYAFGNARHGYFGFGANQNVDLLGKVMQYHMQHEAPPRYAAITDEVDDFLARGDDDPWHVVLADPALRANGYALAADYGRSVILAHPVQFVADTIPVAFDSLRSSDPHSQIVNGPFSVVIRLLQTMAGVIQYTLLLFPFVALAWWSRLVRPRKASELAVRISGLALICAYPLAVTTLFVYTQYARLNAPYDPLMIVVVWLSVMWVMQRLARGVKQGLERSVTRRRATKGLPAYVD